MDYPQELSAQARARVEAERLRAKRDLDESGKQPGAPIRRTLSYGPSGLPWTDPEKDLHNYILRVFLAFAREACQLGVGGIWSVDQIRSETDEFLRRFTIETYYERGHDSSGHRFREMVSHWNGSLLPDLEQEFHKSDEWRQFEAELLTVAEQQSASNRQPAGPAESIIGSVARPNQVGGTEPSGHRSIRTDAGPGVNEVNGKGAERREKIDAFIQKCNQEMRVRTTRTHIWRAAGHRSPRQFQFWQASDPKATVEDDRNFRRILAMSPTDFAALLKKKSII
jgi:hypothetical protein